MTQQNSTPPFRSCVGVVRVELDARRLVVLDSCQWSRLNFRIWDLAQEELVILLDKTDYDFMRSYLWFGTWLRTQELLADEAHKREAVENEC